MESLKHVFSELKNIMLPYAGRMHCTSNNDSELSIDTAHILKNNKPLWFGAVQIKKNYVSYHLMPAYLNPGLLESVSSELRKRMHGKSCFNFSSVDALLFKELAELTETGFKDYKRMGYV